MTPQVGRSKAGVARTPPGDLPGRGRVQPPKPTTVAAGATANTLLPAAQTSVQNAAPAVAGRPVISVSAIWRVLRRG